jgi:hypothetical protein
MPAALEVFEDEGLNYSGELQALNRIEVSERTIDVGLWELEGCEGPPQELVLRIFRSMYLAHSGALPQYL